MQDHFEGARLKDILNFAELEKLFKSYSLTSGLDVALYDVDGREQLCVRKDACVCNFIKDSAVCSGKIVYSGKKAEELAAPYIYETACGLVMCITAVTFGEETVGFITTGPVILWERDDFFEGEFCKNCLSLGVDLKKSGFDFSSIRQIDCETMTSSAKMLAVMVGYMVDEEQRYVKKRLEIAKLLRQGGEKAREPRGQIGKYPIETEKTLIACVQLGEGNEARSILNDFLGEIFLYAGGDLEIIKAKLYEFTAFLSRTAVEAGAKLESLTNIVKKTASLMLENVDYNDLCLKTVEILDDYIDVVYACRGKRSASKHMAAAMRYIHENYEKEITLDALAKNVYVSAYYLSHLFREETGTTFSDYLSKVRIEKSKTFLKEGMSVEDAAYKSGFNDGNYFIRIFKKYVGITPAKYKKTSVE
ncbi:MAG: hypothetical protein DBX59_02185 [Bacillota bacterium]|nr:MAG: hypothetical protein DBX59_02185 [Bacillota bacterium]